MATERILHTYVDVSGQGTHSYKEALEQNRQAYKACAQSRGPMDPGMISMKHNEAFILAHMEEMEDAENCMLETYKDCKKAAEYTGNPQHDNILATWNKWALIAILRKDYKLANEYNNMAWQGYDCRFGKKSHITLSAICCRALILDALEHDDAKAFYDLAYSGMKEHLPEADPDTISCMYLRALAFERWRMSCGANDAFKEALEVCKKYFEKHSGEHLRYWEMCWMKTKLKQKTAATAH